MSVASTSFVSAESTTYTPKSNPSADFLPKRPYISIPTASPILFFQKPRSRHSAQTRPQSTPTTPNNMGHSTNPSPFTASISPQSQPDAIVHAFPSRLSGTTVYVVVDPITEEAAIINPVLDLDPLTNEIRTRSADRLLKFISDEGLTIKWILETALHHNRISACRYIQLMLRHIADGIIPQVCVGENSFCTCGEDDSPTNDTASRTSQKHPEAFDKLFEDGEQVHLGNIMGLCAHLDDHAGITYTFGQYVFESNALTLNSEALQGTINHAEPPPEPSSTGPVSSRQSKTIDEVLGSADDTSPTSTSSVEPVSTSPMLAYYAEQVNTRGGRIPKKINMAPAQRKASLSEADGDLTGNGKGKERERNVQPTPLRIPRKLSVIMC